MSRETCDAQGYFEFRKVADGDFFVDTSIFWLVGSDNRGGNLMRRLRLSGGATERVVLRP